MLTSTEGGSQKAVGLFVPQFMKPNWKQHISIVGEGSTKRNKIIKLNFCLHEFRGSATRAVNHLAERGTVIRGCPQIPESVRDMYGNYDEVSDCNSGLDESHLLEAMCRSPRLASWG